MRKIFSFDLEAPSDFLKNLLVFSKDIPVFSLFVSNQWPGSSADLIAAVDSFDSLQVSHNSFEELKSFYEKKKDWLFGLFSYDLKNEMADTGLMFKNRIEFPALYFYQPKYIFIQKGRRVDIHYRSDLTTLPEIEGIIKRILSSSPFLLSNSPAEAVLRPTLSKQDYIQKIESIKKHISRGDIYEVNFCMEYYAEDAVINPAEVFFRLNAATATPFSGFCRFGEKYLLCASPERFLKKKGDRIISQPIKGTARRGEDLKEDEEIVEALGKNPKDISENVMIVDLVRNDLSRTCDRVCVDELSGIYSFRQWHQMISTISGTLKENVHFIDSIKNAFPMGSMTGAPKIKAMEIIEKYEACQRGVYSGALGYFTPENDFDLNVVIRSIVYDRFARCLSFHVGSAVTTRSEAEKEYEECLLKAKGMFEALGSSPQSIVPGKEQKERLDNVFS